MINELPATGNPVQILDCTLDEYFGDSLNSLSHSDLEVFRYSPRLYQGRMVNRLWPRDAKTAFDVGHVFHDLILGRQYVITWETFAKIQTVASWTSCEPPERKPDFTSLNGAEYWKMPDNIGVVRRSMAWGAIGNSYWHLRGRGTTGQCVYSHFLASENFTPIPDDVLSSDGAKRGNSWKEFQAAHAGEILLKPKEFEPLGEMGAEVRRHGFAHHLLFELEGANEVKLRWFDGQYGLVRRCMIDALRLPADNHGKGIIGDLKSVVRMPHPRTFAKVVYDLGYHRQMAYYQDAVEALCGERLPWVFIVSLKVAPYTCRTFALSQKWDDIARKENHVDLGKFMESLNGDDWRDDGEGEVIEVDPPNYAEYSPDWGVPEL